MAAAAAAPPSPPSAGGDVGGLCHALLHLPLRSPCPVHPTHFLTSATLTNPVSVFCGLCSVPSRPSALLAYRFPDWSVVASLFLTAFPSAHDVQTRSAPAGAGGNWRLLRLKPAPRAPSAASTATIAACCLSCGVAVEVGAAFCSVACKYLPPVTPARGAAQATFHKPPFVAPTPKPAHAPTPAPAHAPTPAPAHAPTPADAHAPTPAPAHAPDVRTRTVHCRGVAVPSELMRLLERVPLEFWCHAAVDRDGVLRRIFERGDGGQGTAEEAGSAEVAALFAMLEAREGRE